MFPSIEVFILVSICLSPSSLFKISEMKCLHFFTLLTFDHNVFIHQVVSHFFVFAVLYGIKPNLVKNQTMLPEVNNIKSDWELPKSASILNVSLIYLIKTSKHYNFTGYVEASGICKSEILGVDENQSCSIKKVFLKN